jgi:hypothetical protein
MADTGKMFGELEKETGIPIDILCLYRDERLTPSV